MHNGNTQKVSKGIILAGGTGSRLYPVTGSLSKHLLPVYDKPLIYYPLSVLMLAGVYEILIISRATDLPFFEAALGDGSQWGVNISYALQEEPKGIAEALIIGEEFIDGDSVALILGDNIFYGSGLQHTLTNATNLTEGAHIFVTYVRDPERFGIAGFNTNGDIVSIEEKPRFPKSSYAITGFYVYDGKATSIAKSLSPSARGELEISDLNNHYLKKGNLRHSILGRGIAWLDTGTPKSLLDASNFVSVLEQRQGLKICCPEEVAYRQGLIDQQDLKRFVREHPNTDYANYIKTLIDDTPILQAAS